ncbi:ribosomal RNA small subunit methyltransferase G [Bombiscardovia apis]|uniref:Ribosomal RNA small subunit methyltransferase G n=1 Tax=Bombiscardovia apis TaxID=2932182 RepID=A0ABM8BF55_9BIFI|nr:16S rRNA (guanine(527)-N(7))-methyltransferase RsmG [Bombiscardovia apis]BDR55435.1 ribosomal RNA small subunit methyltransferase G [Bombiscardovia apis]
MTDSEQAQIGGLVIESGPVPDQLEGSELLGTVLGPALEPLQLFHDKLAREGLTRGIIGPRDTSIIWERHILNSAAIVPFVKQACQAAGSRRVADVGSGGGFPGVIVAVCLPDYEITLIEPMERRVEWLNEVVNELGLTNVAIVRSRAEDLFALAKSTANSSKKKNGKRKKSPAVETHVSGQYRTGSIPGNTPNLAASFAAVTCRAVAPLTKLSAWTLPLVQSGGQLVALKGQSAQAEIDKAEKELRKCGGRNPRVFDAPVGQGLEGTHVVVVDKI